MFDSVAADYDQVIDFFGPFGRALVAAADIRPGHRVLDVASGRGACLRPALEAVGPDGSVLGIDLAPEMVERLGAELAAAGRTNAEVRVGDAEALDLPDASFDVVTAGFMIFFPPRPAHVLLELRRVLKAGGRLALSIFDGPAGFDFQADLIRSMGVERASGPSTELNRAEVLEASLAAAGFVGIESTDVIERHRFADADEVERWQRTTGVREALDRFDDATLARYRAELRERLEPFAVDGGGYQLVQRARMTVASR